MRKVAAMKSMHRFFNKLVALGLNIRFSTLYSIVSRHFIQLWNRLMVDVEEGSKNAAAEQGITLPLSKVAQ